MSDLWIVSLFAVTALFVLLPVYWAWRLAALYWFNKPAPCRDDELPKVAVILSLRGADPSLVNCVGGLLRQDYPRYALRIVIDNRQDPAWDMVHGILAQGVPPHVDVQVSVLEQRRDTCSLKVSAQLQAIAQLHADCEAVVLIDADSIPAPDWLRSMVAPFRDPMVGATTGIRWFAPRDTQWGTIVRHLYNSASFTQMYYFRMPWGGSLGIRTHVLRQSDILDLWSQSFCEDIGTYGVVRDLGLRLAFVPEATQVNPEAIDLKSCYNFILRQLLCVRLHHVSWPALFLTNIANLLALFGAGAFLAWGVASESWGWVAASAGLFVAYLGGLLSALNVGEVLIRRIVSKRGETVPPVLVSWKIIPAALLTQGLSLYCLVKTLFLRRIDWRGITYAIHGPENIRLLEYRPFQTQPADPTHSVI